MKMESPNGNGAALPPIQAPTSKRDSGMWPVWVILATGALITASVFFNLRFAETALRDFEHQEARISTLQNTSWATLFAGLTFTGFAALFVAALLRQNVALRTAHQERGRDLQGLVDQRVRLERELARTKIDLDRRVQERTQELADSNKFMLTEITDRKRAEALLAAEKERLMTMLRSIGDGVIATDADGYITLMNRVAEELTAWKQDEGLKKPLYDVFRVVEGDTGHPFTQLAERLGKAGAYDLSEDLVLVSRDGNERHIAHSNAPLYDVDGQVMGMVIAFRDMTEKRRVEEERLKTSKLESIALLAGGIAHDYNNLLTAIMGNLSLAQMSITDSPAELPSLLNEVENAALRAKGLTHQLLTFAKGGAPVKQTASLVEIIKDSAEFVLRGSNTKCAFKFAPDTSPAEVDLGQISQVVQNLVINADQAMPAGGHVTISTENVTISAENKALPLRPGRYIKISIADDGPGMSPEVQKKVFEPYFTTKEKGSGLGLTTSFAILRKHDGFMGMESTLGKGTTFNLYLPAAEAEESQTLGKAQPLILRGNGKILVMDDEESIRNLVKRMLESVGYKVVAVRDGQTALDAYAEHEGRGQPFDAVLLDLTVPGGMGGRECAKLLLGRWPQAKAVVSSGYVNDPVMERYKKFGFAGMVTKPYTLGELTYALKRILG